MIKLELKHLAPYLPYKLGVASGDEYDSILNNIGVMGTHYDVYAPNNYTIYQLCKCEDGVFKYMGVRPIQVKPILRPLSAMTKDEAYELMNIIFVDDDIKGIDIEIIGSLIVISSPEKYGSYITIIDEDKATVEAYYEDYSHISSNYPISYEIYEWLFKHHFDIFNLIKNNLAIDKTKL